MIIDVKNGKVEILSANVNSDYESRQRSPSGYGKDELKKIAQVAWNVVSASVKKYRGTMAELYGTRLDENEKKIAKLTWLDDVYISNRSRRACGELKLLSLFILDKDA